MSWEVSGRSWRSVRGPGRSVGCQRGVIGGHHEVVEGQWETIAKKKKKEGPKMKQEHKVSYRCSLPSPLQKRSKDCIEVLSFGVFFDFCKKFELYWFGLG